MLTTDILHSPFIRHGFFTRTGGVSAGIYASLNCGPGSGDDRASVIENRKRVAAALGRPDAQVLTLYQVHGAEAAIVAAPWEIGCAPKADAMATNCVGIVLGILTADCVPVLLADPDAGVIGAAHAGWKGAFAGVVESVVAAMERLGAARARISAAIGPAISQKNYEVGPEFRARFVAADAAEARFFVASDRADHWRFDLQACVADRLQRAEIAGYQRLDVCTYENGEDFFSFRRATHRGEADYGRQISAIALAR
jgi:YfiH family protein